MKKIILFLFLSSVAQGKLSKIQYQNELCQCQGEIDSSVAKSDEIQTAMVWGLRGGPDLSIWTTWAKLKPEELKAVRAEDEMKLNASEEKLKKAPLPDLPEWKEIRELDLRDLNLSRQLQFAELDFLINGDIAPLLKPFQETSVPSECRKYAESLKTSAKMKKDWKSMSNEICKNNGDPQMCRKNLKTQTEGPRGELQMKVHFLSFGWHNCVNQAWRKDNSKNVMTAQEKLKSQIQNLKCNCDEP